MKICVVLLISNIFILSFLIINIFWFVFVSSLFTSWSTQRTVRNFNDNSDGTLSSVKRIPESHCRSQFHIFYALLAKISTLGSRYHCIPIARILPYRYKRGISLLVHYSGLVIRTFLLFVLIASHVRGPRYQYICSNFFL